MKACYGARSDVEGSIFVAERPATTTSNCSSTRAYTSRRRRRRAGSFCRSRRPFQTGPGRSEVLFARRRQRPINIFTVNYPSLCAADRRNTLSRPRVIKILSRHRLLVNRLRCGPVVKPRVEALFPSSLLDALTNTIAKVARKEFLV